MSHLPDGRGELAEFKRCVDRLADTGCYTADNVTTCEQVGIEPLIAVKREHRHPPWSARFREPEDQPYHPVTGFRQFLTRGLDNVQNEWPLVSETL